MHKTNSDFQDYCLDGIVRVIDLNRKGTLSILTNANSVLQFVINKYPSYKAIISRDSLGYWDQFVIKDGKLESIKSLDTKNENEAIRKIKLQCNP